MSSDEYDKGPIIGQAKTAVNYPIKIKDAITQISPLYAELTCEIVGTIAKGEALKTMIQNDEEATYSLWRDEEDLKIDWSQSASDIQLFIDSVGEPYRGAKTSFDDQVIRISDTTEIPDVEVVNRDCGKIIFYSDDRPVVVCGQGLLRIDDAHYDHSGDSIFPLKKFTFRSWICWQILKQ